MHFFNSDNLKMERLEIISHHIAPLIVTESSQYAISIKLNRPRSLNAFSSALINSLYNTLSNLQANLLLFSSTSPSHFCAGGDIKERALGGLRSIRHYALMVSNFYQISLFPSSVSLIQGLSIGAGCGLAMACRYRVGTDSTRFIMPESTIGLVPDCGASYFIQLEKRPTVFLHQTTKQGLGFVSNDHRKENHRKRLLLGTDHNSLRH